MFAGLAFINPVKRWVNYSSPESGNSDIKIVSFNTRAGGRGSAETGPYLKSLDADVLLLQEDAGIIYRFDGYQKANPGGGLTILTKHRIVKQQLIDPQDENVRIPGLQVDIEIKGKVYRFIDVYLNPFRFQKDMVRLNGNTDTDEQKIKDVVKRLIPTFKKHQDQVTLIREAIDNSPYPVILAGDFNSVPNSYEYYHLSDGLEDAFVEAGRGSATSFHDYKFPIRIDYIFSSQSLKVISYKVDRSVSISDHYPVIVKFSTENR
ncbi:MULTISPECIES: endonuclease/exonuclease/phosphatase family protein [Chryseobacterium]|uniref:AP endonuclease n=1 Tax=Chryseobacterium candidae TaxID=1978493 RepID=A0ABY2R3U4_9FLAO|nr:MULTISPECIES: endonuclease/exonuclease/phosphatase family protein [Chryseobacterium]THV56699.1 AP endonuclease [Chryseobacterium candidae]